MRKSGGGVCRESSKAPVGSLEQPVVKALSVAVSGDGNMTARVLLNGQTGNFP